MKKYIYCALVVCCPLFLQAQYVGIKTTSPVGVLHIDAAGDNGATISPAQALNDVVINTKGYLGIGTVNPQAKLTINNNGVAGAIRIVDGRQADGLILTSDASGNASWAYPITSTGKIEATLPLGPQTFAASGTTKATGSDFTVRADGYHVFEIRWYAKYSAAATRQTYTATHIRLFKNGALADEYEAYQDVTTDANDAVTFFTALATQAKTGDVLYIDVRPGIAPGNLILARTSDLTTAKIIVKRLNIK